LAKDLKNTWLDIDEVEANKDEKKLYKQYKESEEKLVPLENLIEELNLDAEQLSD